METKSGQEKFIWSNAMIDNMIDIICSDEILKKKLIFRNQKLAANTNSFEKIADLMNQRAANNDRKYRVSFSQARNKFKKLVSECKTVSLTKRPASGIARYQVEKGYGKWWDILFPLVASRESSDRNNMIEPSFNTINQRVESETQLNEDTNVLCQNGKVNMKKQKEKKIEHDR